MTLARAQVAHTALITTAATHTSYEKSLVILTHKDEAAIKNEISGLKKINPNTAPDITTRLKYTILSIDGDEDRKSVREFVDNYLLARDAKALRNYVREIQPDVDLTFFPEGSQTRIDIPIGLGFFWPND